MESLHYSCIKMNSSYWTKTASVNFKGCSLVLLFWDSKKLMFHTLCSWTSAIIFPDQAVDFFILPSVILYFSYSVFLYSAFFILYSVLPECLLVWQPFNMHFTFYSFIEQKLLSTYCVLGTHLGYKYINEQNKDPCPSETYILVGEKW